MDMYKYSKDVPYFQNANQVVMRLSSHDYSIRIKPKDFLSITVQSIDPETSQPFNLNFSTNSTTGQQSPSESLQKYLVENDGTINFPVIGRLKVVGKTTDEVRDLISSRVNKYFTKRGRPVVTVKIQDFFVTVVGEVRSPKDIQITGDHIGLVEALAQAGDLTEYGRRDNILLIREGFDGAKVVHRFDLRDANVFNDPFYYLQQRDCIYVMPNDLKAKEGKIQEDVNYYTSMTRIPFSIANLIVSLYNK